MAHGFWEWAPKAAGVVTFCLGVPSIISAVMNWRNSLVWKRTELANSYLKDLTDNEEIAFVCRALEWGYGRLVVPEKLRPLVENRDFIEHDEDVLIENMHPSIGYDALSKDLRIQLYRTTVDTFLSYIYVIAGAVEKNVYTIDEVEPVEYWLRLVEKSDFLSEYIDVYGYRSAINKLSRWFLLYRSPYWRDWWQLTLELQVSRYVPSVLRASLIRWVGTRSAPPAPNAVSPPRSRSAGTEVDL